MSDEEDEFKETLSYLNAKKSGRVMVQVNDRRGQTDEPEEPVVVVDPREEYNRRLNEQMERVQEATLRQMSTRGALHLPAELEEARWKHGIIDPLFRIPLFERILVWQFPESDTDLQGSPIEAPEMTKARLAQENPRGILMGAGAAALDILRSHGLRLGYTITFLRNSSWRLKCGDICGIKQCLLPLVIGDIIDCDELNMLFRTGVIRYEWDSSNRVHRLFDTRTNEFYDPITPHIGDDYAH